MAQGEEDGRGSGTRRVGLDARARWFSGVLGGVAGTSRSTSSGGPGGHRRPGPTTWPPRSRSTGRGSSGCASSATRCPCAGDTLTRGWYSPGSPSPLWSGRGPAGRRPSKTPGCRARRTRGRGPAGRRPPADSDRRLIVLGEPGTGKTILLVRLVLDLLLGHRAHPRRTRPLPGLHLLVEPDPAESG